MRVQELARRNSFKLNYPENIFEILCQRGYNNFGGTCAVVSAFFVLVLGFADAKGLF